MKYYAVASTFYDDGRVTAALVDTVETIAKPESAFVSTLRADRYVDWFESLRDAWEFIKETQNA